MTERFEPEIAEAARAIYHAVAVGENDSVQHAWQIANAIEHLLERYFPDLATANALDPRETAETILELYTAVHEDTAHQPQPCAAIPAPVAKLP